MKITESLIDRTTVFIATGEDGERYITDRYILWRMDDAPERLRKATDVLPDGVWSLSATGAAKPAALGQNTDLALLAKGTLRILNGTMYDARDESLRPTSIVQDLGTPRRFWANDKDTYLLDDRLQFSGGYTLVPAGAMKVAILLSGTKAGCVMAIRPDEALSDLRMLAERFTDA